MYGYIRHPFYSSLLFLVWGILLKQVSWFGAALAVAATPAFARKSCEELKAEIVLQRHRNPPEGDGGPNHWAIWLRDPDGYVVVLASPYGTTDGNWKP